jgi:hypothetical protein
MKSAADDLNGILSDNCPYFTRCCVHKKRVRDYSYPFVYKSGLKQFKVIIE